MKYLIVIVVALVLATSAWLYIVRTGDTPGSTPAARGAPEIAVVTAVPVRYEQINETVEALGTAVANESVTIAAKVTDTVRSVEFDDGDYVEAGDILVQLTNSEEQAALAEAEANLEDAETQLRRVEDIAGQGLAPQADLDLARSRAAAARARLDGIVARLGDRVIRAPFSGILGFRDVSPGTLVQPNTPITTLDDISTIKLDFTVPETFIGEVLAGATVRARSASYPQRVFDGEVRTIGSRVDPVTRAISVRAHVPNDDRALRAGMLLTVEVLTQQRTALVVPESAVFQVQDRAFVYRVEADRIARQRPVALGARRFGIVEIVEGLAEGDLVVSEGIVKLRDGAAVRFASDEQALGESAPAPNAQPVGVGG